MIEMYLLYESVLPTILVADEIRAFLKNLLGKFVRVPVIKAATLVDFKSDNSTIMVVTKQCLKCLRALSVIINTKSFFEAVTDYYGNAASHALKKLPFSENQ